MAVILRDIAERTGYSINTVSHALKGKNDISKETTVYIKKVAKEMGYIGNAAASSMRSGYSKTIAVILGDISNPHFSIIIKEIETYVKKAGYTFFILNTDEDLMNERKAIISALSKNVDGIILCPSQQNTENIEYLKHTEIPFTLIGRYFSGISSNYVICDDKNSGYLAASHLLNLGHSKILFLDGDSYISSSKERYEGYLKALSEFNIEQDDSMVYNISVKLSNEDEQISKILTTAPEYTAVIAFSDMLACKVICILKKMGKKIPDDCSVIGFDNIQDNFPFPVELTSVGSLKNAMAHNAANLLIDIIEQKEQSEEKNIIIPTGLSIRESTKMLKEV